MPPHYNNRDDAKNIKVLRKILVYWFTDSLLLIHKIHFLLPINNIKKTYCNIYDVFI